MITNPAHGQLNRETVFSPDPVRLACEFGLARRVHPSRPVPSRVSLTCSFSILRLNLVSTHGIPPDFRGGVNLFI